jgi:hypothetical protein
MSRVVSVRTNQKNCPIEGEAAANGVVKAEYAELWAAYLDDNGCRFQDNC